MIAENDVPYELGKSARVRHGSSEFAIVTIGPILKQAMDAAAMLENEGISVSVINARFVKPIDSAIMELFNQNKTVLLVEDNSIACGFGSAVIEQALQIANETSNPDLHNSIGKAVLLGGPDLFIPAASRSRQLDWMQISAKQISETIKKLKFQSQTVDKSLQT